MWVKEKTGITLGKMKNDTEEDDRNEREVTNRNSNTTYVGNHVGLKGKFGREKTLHFVQLVVQVSLPGPTCLCTVFCGSEFFCIAGKRRGEVARSVCSLVCDLRETTGASSACGFEMSFKWWAVRLPWDETRVVALLMVGLFFRRVLLKVDSPL